MKSLLFLIILAAVLSGCATTSTPTVTIGALPTPYQQGVYHTVLKGETLWRIAKAYNTDIKKIIDTNRMPDASDITTGQKIFIPGAKKTVKTSQYMPAQEKSKTGYVWPLRGKIISYYGSTIDGVKNKGIDIKVNQDQLIVASRSGKVVFCDNKVKGMGKVIILEHENGY
ncbi:MAG: LysM peptidoglycan-binding domain-containing protein, partial [Candidatus Omnitrophica bacterium]|nr:LysM peptidoglycan-binding domain-containing protein [Candidatus Omnitrophota bacterium]